MAAVTEERLLLADSGAARTVSKKEEFEPAIVSRPGPALNSITGHKIQPHGTPCPKVQFESGRLGRLDLRYHAHAAQVFNHGGSWMLKAWHDGRQGAAQLTR